MIGKDELIDRIEKTDLERITEKRDAFEKHIFLDDDKVLIVGYGEEEHSEKQDPEEETVTTYYWYWEIRDSQKWDVIFENHDNKFSFCESEHGTFSNEDRIEDVVGDIDESEVCAWSDRDWIEDISEYIADEVLHWLKVSLKG
jgi:hypothetical protein